MEEVNRVGLFIDDNTRHSDNERSMLAQKEMVDNRKGNSNFEKKSF